MKEQIFTVLLPWLMDSVKKQGFSFLLIGLMTYYFYNQNQVIEVKFETKLERMEEKVEILQERIIEYNTKDRLDLMKVVEANTYALENFKCK